MPSPVARLVSLSNLALLALSLVLLSLGTGCGAIAAAANPKVAWAISDPAPMSVVVRRADAADTTSKEVDRLLTATPASKDSEWMQQTAPAPADAAGEMKAVSQMSFYVESKARVVPAEIWVRVLPTVKSSKGEYPNLLGAIDKALSDKYQHIMEKKQEIAGLRALIATEEAAMDEKGLSDGDKKEHKQKIADLEKMADTSEKDVEPLQKDFVAAAKDAAGKAPAEAREKAGVALVNLRQAVDDAQIANGAAAVRYPLALPSLPSSVKAMVPVLVADIIQEKTGKRPNLNKLSPEVKLDGTSVSLTLNGLDASDIGKLKMGELVTESIDRTQKWVVHAIGLLGTVAATKEVLSFQADVLDALIDGFTTGGWKVIVAAKIPAQSAPEVARASGSKLASAGKVDTTTLTSAAASKAAAGKGTKGLSGMASGALSGATNRATADVTAATTKAVGKAATDATTKAVSKAATDAADKTVTGTKTALVQGATKAAAAHGASRAAVEAFTP